MNTKQQRAFDAICRDKQNVFVTGGAGVGKSYLIKKIMEELNTPKARFTAATGIAASHFGGTTFHSALGLGIGKQCASKLIADLKYQASVMHSPGWWMKHGTLLVVDEISMLSLWIVTLASEVMCAVRNDYSAPFGGMQVVFFGDFYQLPPVRERRSTCMICGADATIGLNGNMVCPRVAARKSLPHPAEKTRCDEFHFSQQTQFIFEANANGRSIMNDMNMITIVLTEVIRQKDERLVEMLNRIRVGDPSDQDIEWLMKRRRKADDSDGIIPTKLYTHRRNVYEENMRMYKALEGEEQTFKAIDTLYDTVKKKASTKTRVMETLIKMHPTCVQILRLRIGCQVMFTTNNPHQGYYNGTRGTVVSFAKSGPKNPIVKFLNPDQTYSTVTVDAAKWSHTDGSVVATREQLPLAYAWAITIHKSQGLTLTKAQMALGTVFEDGMVYVALSRIASIYGLYIESFNRLKITANKLVGEFYSNVAPIKQASKRTKTK